MSREKIIEALEKRPSGLSISELAEATGLHRNTVSKIIEELEKSGEVKMKEVGKAKIYFLKTYEAIHTTLYGYRGVNISIGIGISDLSDGFNAAVSAAKQAAMQSSKGAMPTFSIVFVSSKYNSQIDKVVQGINKILGTSWIGCTTDREINSILGYSEGTIQVLCIDTPHLYFGVGVSENYRKDPFEEGKKATMQAIENCPIDRSRFATTQFMRGSKKSFTEIIKNPPYFILTFIGGTYYENKVIIPGMEGEFLDGIKEVVGSFIPIVGASASSKLEDMMEFKGENYVFANGRYYKYGAVVCFVVSELQFSFGFSHPYDLTNVYGVITKISKDRKTIEEINNKPAKEEYKRLVSSIKERFSLDAVLEKIFAKKYEDVLLFIKYPAIFVTTLHEGFPLALRPSLDNKTLISPQKVTENMSFVIGKYNKRKTVEATPNSIKEDIKADRPVFALLFSCAARGFLLHKTRTMDKFVKNLSSLLPSYIGIFANGEIGGRKEFKFMGFSDIYILCFDKMVV
ncbi:MAG: FIST N-terminal domain-containing protein [Candidatus Aenigmatarchaeota archaeon]